MGFHVSLGECIYSTMIEHTPIIGSQMEKKVENEMETGLYREKLFFTTTSSKGGGPRQVGTGHTAWVLESTPPPSLPQVT